MIDTPSIQQTDEQITAVIHLNIPGMDMPKHMDPAIKEVMKALADQGIKPTGPLFTFHHRMPSDTFDFEVGFPVAKKVTPAGRVVPSALPAAKVARTIYHGPYEGLGGAWGEFIQWVKKNELKADTKFYERYLDDPSKQDPKDYRTEINRVLIG